MVLAWYLKVIMRKTECKTKTLDTFVEPVSESGNIAALSTICAVYYFEVKISTTVRAKLLSYYVPQYSDMLNAHNTYNYQKDKLLIHQITCLTVTNQNR